MGGAEERMVGIGGGGRGVANTRDAIVAAARREFLSKGFHEASLRSIASEAGVTTGAIYGYFSSKEALLDAAVGNVGEGLCKLCQRAFIEFESRSIEERSFSNMGVYEEHVQLRIIDYIYDHHDECPHRPPRPAARGGGRDLDCLAELEVRSTRAYGSELRAAGWDVRDPNPLVLEVIARQFFQALLQPIVRGVGREEARAFIMEYGRFYYEGGRAPVAGPAPRSLRLTGLGAHDNGAHSGDLGSGDEPSGIAVRGRGDAPPTGGRRSPIPGGIP